MLEKNQYISVKWGTKNKDWFISKGYEFTKYGDALIVRAEDLMKTSKAVVILVCDICTTSKFETSYYNYTKSKTGEHYCQECIKIRNLITVECYSCKKEFTTTKTAKRASKSGNLFCSNKCVGVYNSKQKDKKLEKKCVICKTIYKTKRANFEKSVACSNKCQAKWQSLYLVGENANNYKGGNRTKSCEMCNEDYDCNSPYQFLNRKFCSADCKREYWVSNTLTSANFIENRRKGNEAYRKIASTRETKPERMVREWLQSQDEYFIQEEGFFGKYFADFYLPLENLIIEVMGDYWHGNPKLYGADKIPFSQQQLNQIEKDKKKKNDFLHCGFTYVEIWEKDIYENLEKTMQSIMLKIYPRNDYTQDIQHIDMLDEDIV